MNFGINNYNNNIEQLFNFSLNEEDESFEKTIEDWVKEQDNSIQKKFSELASEADNNTKDNIQTSDQIKHCKSSVKISKNQNYKFINVNQKFTTPSNNDKSSVQKPNITNTFKFDHEKIKEDFNLKICRASYKEEEKFVPIEENSNLDSAYAYKVKLPKEIISYGKFKLILKNPSGEEINDKISDPEFYKCKKGIFKIKFLKAIHKTNNQFRIVVKSTEDNKTLIETPLFSLLPRKKKVESPPKFSGFRTTFRITE